MCLLVPENRLRIRNFNVQEAVNFVLAPDSDSELSDLSESCESEDEIELEIEQVDRDVMQVVDPFVPSSEESS